MEALDSVRKDIWRDAQNSYKEAKILPQVPVEDLQKKSRLNERS